MVGKLKKKRPSSTVKKNKSANKSNSKSNNKVKAIHASGDKNPKEENIFIKKCKKVQGSFKILPKAIRILLQFNAVLAFFYLLLTFLLDKTLIFGILVEGTKVRFFHFFIFVLLMYAIFGISYRNFFAYYLMMILYGFGFLNAFVSIFLISEIGDKSLISIKEIFIPILIFVGLINGFCFWYMSHKHKYFVASSKKKAYKKTVFDKIFIRIIYSAYIIITLSLITFIIIFTTFTLPLLNKVINDISGMEETDSLAYCMEPTMSLEKRDLCYMSVAIIYPEEERMDMLCDRINNSFYRFTCYNRFK